MAILTMRDVQPNFQLFHNCEIMPLGINSRGLAQQLVGNQFPSVLSVQCMHSFWLKCQAFVSIADAGDSPPQSTSLCFQLVYSLSVSGNKRCKTLGKAACCRFHMLAFTNTCAFANIQIHHICDWHFVCLKFSWNAYILRNPNDVFI